MTLINKHEDLRELLRRPASSSSTICLPESHRRVTLVIPTLNEPKHLVHMLPTIPYVVDGLIIVDGKSIDGTLEVVREFRPDAVIVPEQRHGKGHALRAVFEAARGDIIVMMDTDGSMDVSDIGGSALHRSNRGPTRSKDPGLCRGRQQRPGQVHRDGGLHRRAIRRRSGRTAFQARPRPGAPADPRVERSTAPPCEGRTKTVQSSPTMHRVVSPVPRDKWHSVLGGDRSALPEHSPEWVAALTEGGRYCDAGHLCTLSDGGGTILPLARRRGPAAIGGGLLSYLTGRDLVGRTGSGELVRWTATELAGERGCNVFSMGESGRSAALAQFKKKFGASPFGCGKLQLGRLPWTRADAARPSASRDSTMPDRRPSDMRRSMGQFRPGNER